jgi:hypothetical protein
VWPRFAFARAVQHIHAGAGAHLDPAFHFQRNQGFAHRGPAHAQLLGQVAFGRQPRAGANSPTDQRAQLLGNLPVQALGFDGLQGMARVRKRV